MKSLIVKILSLIIGIFLVAAFVGYMEAGNQKSIISLEEQVGPYHKEYSQKDYEDYFHSNARECLKDLNFSNTLEPELLRGYMKKCSGCDIAIGDKYSNYKYSIKDTVNFNSRSYNEKFNMMWVLYAKKLRENTKDKTSPIDSLFHTCGQKQLKAS